MAKSPVPSPDDPIIPTVVVTVSKGVASVVVNGKVRVHHIDCDVEGEFLTAEQVDGRMAGEIMTGSAAEVGAALRDARDTLEHYMEEPAPKV
jgi:hypothetical protein